MFIIGAEGVFQGEPGGIQEREYLALYPLAAQGFGPWPAVVIQGVQLLQKRLEDAAPRCNFSIPVHFQADGTGETVDDIIHRRDIEGDAFVPLPEGDVGETADIQAVIVIPEQQIVSHGDQGRPLAAQHDVQPPEIAYRGNLGDGCDGRPVPNLVHHLFGGFVEDGAAMGGDDVRSNPEFLHEIVHPLSQELPVGAVESDEVQGAHLLHFLPQGLFQRGGIVVSAGTVNVEGPLAVPAVEGGAAHVQAVDGSTGHEADALNGKGWVLDVHNRLEKTFCKYSKKTGKALNL